MSDSAIFQYFAGAFRSAMKAQGISQVQIVEKTGLTPRTVSLLLSGKHNFKVSSLAAVAEVLGLELTVVKRGRASARKPAPAATEPVPLTCATEVLALSAYAPGARVLEYSVRRQGGTMPLSLADQQWARVSARLNAKGLGSTVREALESTSGSLDTLPRGDVLDAWGEELVGRGWPVNLEGEAVYVEFIQAFGSKLRELGALKLPPALAA